ncbi:MAG: nitronate monooxygenase, partial [candidate division Zixibacteria bacterium]|nr:nitronate monooxygenase [candidate division Zixibacteria bacterium]NIR67637.1 nitronate monooxygenase [candidate division Zixibacteria bacterium]NIS48895.1 nitronate monooxygenase [candidate division Zixibacteria bacterium]NIU16978.1 nitronate monooxygenase [candidate division Zixibacteria bacterium]NIV09126.1 nitronate monooxygenase [candidate division Zixibacteria bacterium]
REGGVGVVSSACIDRIVSKRNGKKVNVYDSVYEEISLSKAAGGIAGINIMIALFQSYNVSVQAAIDAGADVIISGAGLPLHLPTIQKPKDTALIPIVSSARALKLICKKWEKVGYRPDAVVLEGPLAGGHLGFRLEDVELESNRLENLLPPVKDVAMEHGDFPVIVAGGIYTNQDILRFMEMGADGVQMGTRFLATEESSASDDYKQAVIRSKDEDIILANKPGSPCGLPFRIIRQSPMFQKTRDRAPKCDKGYLLLKDRESGAMTCQAKESNEESFCICNGLLSSAGYNPDKEPPLYTVGTNASRVNAVVSVSELMDELAGKKLVATP